MGARVFTYAKGVSGDILIYGLGRSGRGVARFLSAEGLAADWYDQKPRAEDIELMDDYGFRAVQPDFLEHSYRLVVAAPGVPIDHPDLQKLRDNGADVIGEVALTARHRPFVPLLGVTGTAGKGSVTTLLRQLLCALGFKAKEGGNIDPPLLDVIDQASVAVVELSSFQLERIAKTRFPVAVITNLDVDHLDRHKTIENYHNAKWMMVDGQISEDILIVPSTLQENAQKRTLAKVQPFSATCLALSDGTQIAHAAELPRGIHPANAAAALLAAEAYFWQYERHKRHEQSDYDQGVSKIVEADNIASTLRQALLTAQPLAGRFECVAHVAGVEWIDDSIATRTTAVVSSLERAGIAGVPVVWLVGGRDKGADLETIRVTLSTQKVKHIVAFGEDGPQLVAALNVPKTISVTVVPHHAEADGQETMDHVVRLAYECFGTVEQTSIKSPVINHATNQDQDNVHDAHNMRGTVLLAPIGTSFDLYTDYKHRARCFKKSIDQLKRSDLDRPKKEIK